MIANPILSNRRAALNDGNGFDQEQGKVGRQPLALSIGTLCPSTDQLRENSNAPPKTGQ